MASLTPYLPKPRVPGDENEMAGILVSNSVSPSLYFLLHLTFRISITYHAGSIVLLYISLVQVSMVHQRHLRVL